jgi:catechol 2,3-dioxygenase-like lactoylglutathione lyase family enzyme
MANTFHVSVYVRSIPEAVEQYRKMLGIEPAKVRADYAKFEITDPPVILSLNVGGTPGTLSHLGVRYPDTGNVASELVRAKNHELATFRQDGTTCCYAKADKFWVKDADGIPWEMYTLLEDIEGDTAADAQLRTFLAQEAEGATAEGATAEGATAPVAASPCCVPQEASGAAAHRTHAS